MNEEWKGGDMNHPGGGFKVNLLKKAMEQYKDEDDTIVMFTDSYDVIFLADRQEIIDNFKSTGANFLISK
jgi:procollagen-lysine,2-oxoglutarate 5-dioxygenase